MLSTPARQRRAPQRGGGVIARAGAVLLRKPGRTLAVVVFTGILCGIAANALFFQTARHPAPICHGPVIARPALPVSAPVPSAVPPAVPLPPQRPLEKTAAPQPQPAPVVTPAQRPVEAPPRDQIGALLSAGTPAPATDPAPRIVAAQKALMKLGYVVKADGIMGAGTRKAIEMFEQSRKLPVTGDLSARVMRELSALSGVVVP